MKYQTSGVSFFLLLALGAQANFHVDVVLGGQIRNLAAGWPNMQQVQRRLRENILNSLPAAERNSAEASERRLGQHITKEMLQGFLASCEKKCAGVIDAVWDLAQANPDMENPDIEATLKAACSEPHMTALSCAVAPMVSGDCPDMITGILKPVLCMCQCPKVADAAPMMQSVEKGAEIGSADMQKGLDEFCALMETVVPCVNDADKAPMCAAANMGDLEEPSAECNPVQNIPPEGDMQGCSMSMTADYVCTSHKQGCWTDTGRTEKPKVAEPDSCGTTNTEELQALEEDGITCIMDAYQGKEMDAKCCPVWEKSTKCGMDDGYPAKLYEHCGQIGLSKKMAMGDGYNKVVTQLLKQCPEWAKTFGGSDTSTWESAKLKMTDAKVDPMAEPAADDKATDGAFQKRVAVGLLLPALAALAQ